jgi:tetratricopeptide (TPR) repeat protein
LTPLAARAAAQVRQPDWQAQVRKYCDAKDWPSAMRLLEQQITHAPGDVDLKAWRARVLTWSGRLAEAQQEYLAILRVSPNDPDNWAGLASAYAREGKKEDALRALDIALQLDPKRADLHAARARALRALGKQREARAEFRRALTLDPPSTEARVGLKSLRAEPKHELRVGNETDFLSYTAANEGNWASLATRWTPVWATSLGGGAYQRSGVLAAKFIGSATAHLPRLGAITAGGAVGHDNGVIPKSEAFFDLDHGWKTGEAGALRGVELDYGQHWYWYQTARILALNGVAIIYLPREWSFSLAATGARSAFSGAGVEWRPSGSMRLVFPLATWRITQLSGNIFFAAGTENFARSDQIGAFASQTYGGGLRFRFSERQDITCVSSYQRRTQNRTDTYLGFTYGIHF